MPACLHLVTEKLLHLEFVFLSKECFTYFFSKLLDPNLSPITLFQILATWSSRIIIACASGIPTQSVLWSLLVFALMQEKITIRSKLELKRSDRECKFHSYADLYYFFLLSF